MEKTGGTKPVLKGFWRLKMGGVLRTTSGTNSGTFAYDDIKIYAGTYTLNAVINNTNDTAEDYLAILALKKDGKLVSVKFVDQKVEGETTIPVKMDVADADGVTFEAYLWNTFGNMNVQTDSIAW